MTSLDNPRFERHVLLLMALVQFVNIWDFMIVMPLGPDFARALGISASHIGWIAGSYSIAAAISGILCARIIDRFDRRGVLLFCLCGLILGTMAMTLAKNLPMLIAVRMFTGSFGGPLIASSLAVIADVFPEARRGEAMGKVFGSFSVASVIGVPLGLEIARETQWWAPFVVISAMACVVIVTIRMWLPPMRHHLDRVKNTNVSPPSLYESMTHQKAALPAFVLMACSTFAAFLIIPNISAHVQKNLDYPRKWLGLLYLCGGGAAFFSMRITGRYADRHGYAKTCFYATLGLWAALFIGFYAQIRAVPILAVFILFMIAMSTRNVTSNALISKIPKPELRAGFMSLMSAMQHLMSGAGAMCSTFLLTETPEHRIAGIDRAALISMALSVVMPWMMFIIEKELARRKQREAAITLEPLAGV